MKVVTDFSQIDPELAAKVIASMTEEDKARADKIQAAIGLQGATMGSAIQLLIEHQGLEETKRDLCAMADSIDRIIRAIKPPVEPS